MVFECILVSTSIVCYCVLWNASLFYIYKSNTVLSSWNCFCFALSGGMHAEWIYVVGCILVLTSDSNTLPASDPKHSAFGRIFPGQKPLAAIAPVHSVVNVYSWRWSAALSELWIAGDNTCVLLSWVTEAMVVYYMQVSLTRNCKLLSSSKSTTEHYILANGLVPCFSVDLWIETLRHSDSLAFMTLVSCVVRNNIKL